MHRYEELEKLYYKKIYFKYIVFVCLIILFVTAFFLFKKRIQKPKSVDSQIQHKKIQKIKIDNKKPKIIKEIKQKSSNENKKSVEKLHFIVPKVSNFSSIQQTKPQQSKKYVLNPKNKIKEIQLNHKANLDNVKIEEKTPDLKMLIKRFNETKDFNLAILISKIYFNKNNLRNAQIWALRANNINPSSYKSWILFADILLKQKKVKKVKEILKVYIDSYGQNDIIEEKLRSLNDK